LKRGGLRIERKGKKKGGIKASRGSEMELGEHGKGGGRKAKTRKREPRKNAKGEKSGKRCWGGGRGGGELKKPQIRPRPFQKTELYHW